MKTARYIYSILFLVMISISVKSQEDDFYSTDSSLDFEKDCIRGLPEPVMNKDKFPSSKFIIKDFVGFETVTLNDSVKLIIKNTGCESYTLVFRFELPSNNRGTEDISYWYRYLVKLIHEVADRIDSGINIREAGSILINYIDNYDNQPLKLSQEIIISEGEISESMMFDRIVNIENQKIALELSIWIGPL